MHACTFHQLQMQYLAHMMGYLVALLLLSSITASATIIRGKAFVDYIGLLVYRYLKFQKYAAL